MTTKISVSQIETVALTFAHALAKGDYTKAYEMLSRTSKNEMSPFALKEGLEAILSIYKGLGHEDTDKIVDIQATGSLDDVPIFNAMEVGSAYISFAGASRTWQDGMAVMIEEHQPVGYCIGKIIWGAP
jgi:hypothetical protein